MVQAAEEHLRTAYGAIPNATPRRDTPADAAFELRKVAPKIAGMMMLAVVAVVAIATTSQHMGSVQLLETSKLEAKGYDVADAILESAGVHDKKGSIPASIAALAAQAAKEKETGQLTATVQLPQISKKMAAEAAEAKKEIMIEQTIHKKKEAVKEAAKKAKEAKKRAEKEKAKHLQEVQAAASKAKEVKDVKMVSKVAAKAKLATKKAESK